MGAENDPPMMPRLIALLRQSRHDELQQMAASHVAQFPAHAEVWKILGVSQKLQGRDSLAALGNAARLLPGDAEAHVNFGVALSDAARHEEAVACFRHALVLTPNDAPLHNRLGNALRELGLFDDAIASMRNAQRLQPHSAAILGNLGQTLAASGNPTEAVDCFRRALVMQPDYAELHYLLGGTLVELGNLHEAQASLRSALRYSPQYAEACNKLGAVLRESGVFDEAATFCRRALQIKPELIEAYINLANVLRLQSRNNEAEACCREALKRAPGSSESMACLANILAERGQFEEAERLYREAFALAPDFAESWGSIPRLRRMTAEDTPWLDTALALASRTLAAPHAAYLHYGIGKYFDDIGDVEAAFSHYRQAHEQISTYGPKFDRTLFDATINAIIHDVGGAAIAMAGKNGNASTRPVFVIGMPRSGTSLAEQIVAAHPLGFGAGELMFWRNACQRHTTAQLMAGGGNALLSGLADAYLAVLDSHCDTALRMVDKMPSNFMFAGIMAAAFPKARFIHMQRHPIDTCLSIYFQQFDTPHSYADNLDDLVHFYQGYRRLMAHWRQALPAGSMLEVPYEALVADAEGWSRKMIDFISLPWDARCLDFQHNQRSVSTASKWQVRQPINKQSVERWRRYEKFLTPLLALI